MKRMIRMTALALACVMLFAMTACATKLEGVYISKDGLIEQTLTFKENNRVALTAFGIDIEGDYIIKDGQITITYRLGGLHYDLVKSFEKDGSSIYLDGTEFVKEK